MSNAQAFTNKLEPADCIKKHLNSSGDEDPPDDNDDYNGMEKFSEDHLKSFGVWVRRLSTPEQKGVPY